MITGGIAPGAITAGIGIRGIMTTGGTAPDAITAGTGTPGTMIHGITEAGTAPLITTTVIMAITATAGTAMAGTETTGMAVPVIQEDSQEQELWATGMEASPPAAVLRE